MDYRGQELLKIMVIAVATVISVMIISTALVNIFEATSGCL